MRLVEAANKAKRNVYENVEVSSWHSAIQRIRNYAVSPIRFHREGERSLKKMELENVKKIETKQNNECKSVRVSYKLSAKNKNYVHGKKNNVYKITFTRITLLPLQQQHKEQKLEQKLRLKLQQRRRITSATA